MTSSELLWQEAEHRLPELRAARAAEEVASTLADTRLTHAELTAAVMLAEAEVLQTAGMLEQHLR